MARTPEMVKVFQMVVGVDLLGSKMSMSASKNIDIVEDGNGLLCVSKQTGRIIKIPFTNVKGYELIRKYEKPAEVK